jgi:hypothetical protein
MAALVRAAAARRGRTEGWDMGTATHSSPGAGGTSSLPGVLLYLFVPALVQPRPTGIGGKRFFTKPLKIARAILSYLCCALAHSVLGFHTNKP